MICEKCIHDDVCALGCPEFVDSATKNGFCGKFSDKKLYIKLPCRPGEKLYYIEKDCDSCEQLRSYMFTDCVECKLYDDATLYDPVIDCETCKKYLKIKEKTCRDYSRDFEDGFTSIEEAEKEIEKLKSKEV